MAVHDESASSLTVRRATASDVPALNDLWSSDGGWGGLTPQQWHDWYEATPYGQCLVIVAERGDGQIVGQMVGTPSRVLLGGTERKALRLSAPILRTTERRFMRSLDHPVGRIYMGLMRTAVAEGFELAYMLPDASWVQVLGRLREWSPDLGGFVTTEVGCVALEVDAMAEQAPPAGQAAVFDAFGDEFDALWADVAGSAPMLTAVVRRANWLQYKLGGDILRVGLRDVTGRVQGYAAVRLRDGLLLDAVVRAPATYAELLAATVGTMRTARASGHAVPPRLTMMATHDLADAAAHLGAQSVDYTFLFAAASLPGGPPDDTLTAARWLLRGGD